MKPTPDESSEIEPPMTRAIFSPVADESASGEADPAEAENPPDLGPTGGQTRHPFEETDWASSHDGQGLGRSPGREEPPSTGWSSGSDLSRASTSPSRRGVFGKIEPGQTLYAKYLVLRKLGGGAMGDVWLVRHAMLKSQHALKVIVPNFATNVLALRRFQREFEVMATLRHEHAVIIYDATIDSDGGYIDMEFVEGQTIHEILGEARSRITDDPCGPLMPLDWMVRVLDQLCEVLEVAHDKGIVHRDLKPSNLMLVGGRPPGKEYLKVLDFGIAKIRDDPEGAAGRDQEADDNRTQGFIGTPSYGSPEQALGIEDIDGRADLYSVGIIVYEFITGRLPFRGNHWQVMSQNATAPPPSFAQANPRLRPLPTLEAAVMRILAKNRDDRPQTARALFDEIKAAVDALPPVESSGVTPPTWDAMPFYSPPPSSIGTLAPTEAEGAPPPTQADTQVGWVKSSASKSRPAAEGASDLGPTPVQTEKGSRKGLGFWSALAAGSVALILVVVLALKSVPTGPDRTRPPDLAGDSVPPKPKRLDFESYWPETYRRVEGYTEGTPWPEKVRRTTDETVFMKVKAGIYIPESFAIEKDIPPAPDGWPAVIRHDGAIFRRIPGDTFVMGAWDDPNAMNRPDAPAHPVRLTGFYLQTLEVTHGQIEDYLTRTETSSPSEWRQAFLTLKQKMGPEIARKYPATSIKRELALKFADWFGGQLPTEAQWEFAARSMGSKRRYVWGDTPAPDREIARIDALDVTPAPVGSYSKDVTEQGIFDLTGNVQEMCRDAWAPYAKRANALLDPFILPTDPNKADYVIRGGAYSSIGQDCATTRRDDKLAAGDLAENLGFRLVVECPDTRNPR